MCTSWKPTYIHITRFFYAIFCKTRLLLKADDHQQTFFPTNFFPSAKELFIIKQWILLNEQCCTIIPCYVVVRKEGMHLYKIFLARMCKICTHAFGILLKQLYIQSKMSSHLLAIKFFYGSHLWSDCLISFSFKLKTNIFFLNCCKFLVICIMNQK